MSNSNLTSYNFHNSDIRVEQNDKGEVLFCLKDVCSTLQLSNINHVINQLKEEFEGVTLNVTPLKTNGGIQNVTFITEPQLYFVMMRSRAKVAREFRQWICNEVLPSIRQTGTYAEPKKQISKSSWYVREIAEQFIKFGVGNNDLFESVIDVTNRAFKQGYAIAMSKVEQNENNAEGLVLTDEQQKALEHILHYHKMFRPDLLKAYKKLSEFKNQASKLLIALEDIPLSTLYDAATAPDISVNKLVNKSIECACV